MTLAAPARDLEQARELVEAIVGRPLRLAEQAIDVLRLDQALENAKDDLEAEIRDEMILATAAWKAGASLEPALRVTPAMLRILDRLAVIGREEAELELERLGYTGIRRRQMIEAGPAGRDVEGYLRRNLGGVQARIVDELVQVDLSGASHAAIAHALLRVPGARDLASRVVSTALIDGMGQTWEQNQELVAAWEYTAILDGGTCDRCRPLDGTRYATLEALFEVLPNFGPNPNCRGGGRCRCRAVPADAGEVPQNVPGPTGGVDPTLPAWRSELHAIAARIRGPLDAIPKYRESGALAQTLPKLEEAGIVEVRTGNVVTGAGLTYVPGTTMQAVEAEVIRAGEVIDAELDARAGRALGEIDSRSLNAQASLENVRADYTAAAARSKETRKAAGDYRFATRSRLIDRLEQTEGLDRIDAYRRAEEILKTDAELSRLEDAWGIAQRDAQAALEAVTRQRLELAAIETEAAELERATLREILAEHRGMGAADTGGWKFSTGGRRGKVKEILDQAGELYPTDWIERGQANAIKATFRARGRGYHEGFTSGPSNLVVSGGERSKVASDPDGFATAIHELGHHLEHVDPRLRTLEWAFYQRRTRAPGYGAQEQDFRFPRGSGYGAHETYRPDGFVERYMGKTYGNGILSSHEILTMGLEAVWTRSYTLDPEMRRFILGLLATL